MKRIDISNKTKEELMTMLRELQEKIVKFSFEAGEKKLKDFTQIKKTKRDIARILTAVNIQK